MVFNILGRGMEKEKQFGIRHKGTQRTHRDLLFFDSAIRPTTLRISDFGFRIWSWSPLLGFLASDSWLLTPAK